MEGYDTESRMTEFRQVELFGIPALFSGGRIEDDKVPEGLYRYDLRGSDYDPGIPVTIEKNVVVNHAGSILSSVRIPYLDHGEHLKLGSGLSFADSQSKSVDEFQQLWGTLEHYPKTAEILHNNIMLENEKLVWAGHGGPLAAHENIFAIYQVSGENVPNEFMSMDSVRSKGMQVKAVDYDLVYGGLLNADTGLDTLYSKFNTDRPDNFKGHSMSVSDVVVLNRNNELQAWYVDNIGFAQLPDFVRERAELAEAKELIDDFMFREYEGTSKADYSDPAHVGIAFTTTEDEKYDVRVCVNLAACRIEKFLMGNEISRESYSGMRDLIDSRLKDLDFTSLTAVSEQEKTWYERAQDNACKTAVEEAINNGFDYETNRLDRNCGIPVVDRFGPDRVERVLAVTVCMKDADGRFSPETKAWAKDITQSINDGEIRETAGTPDCQVNSHPALLEGFIGFTRRYIDEVRSDSHGKYFDEIEGLASDLDKFALAWDPYEYSDQVENSGDNVNRISDQIRSGDTAGITDWLKRVRSEPGDEMDVRIAGLLLERLDGIKSGQELNDQAKDSEMSL